MKIGTYLYITESLYICTKTFTIGIGQKVVLNYNDATFIYLRNFKSGSKCFYFMQTQTNKKGLPFLTINSKEYNKIKSICKKLIKFYTKAKVKEIDLKIKEVRGRVVYDYKAKTRSMPPL